MLSKKLIDKAKQNPEATTGFGVFFALSGLWIIPAGIAATAAAIDAVTLTGKGVAKATKTTGKAASKTYKTLTYVPPPTPPAPPTKEELLHRQIEAAQAEYNRQVHIAQSFADPDERESFLLGARARLRDTLARLSGGA